MFKLRSTTQLTLIAFGLVVIPLFIALLYSAQQLRKIDQQLNDTIKENTVISTESRELYNLLDSVERSSRQYLAVEDIEFLNTSRLLTNAVHTRLDKLKSMQLGNNISEIVTQTKELTNANGLMLTSSPETIGSQITDNFAKIRALDSSLTKALQLRAEKYSETLAKESSRIKQALLTVSALLIPCTLLSIGYFSRVINRPIAQLRIGIEKLGKQHLDTQIIVDGPKNLELLGKRLEWLRIRLREIDSQKQHFLNHVSHELKTPLTAIREGTELLSEQVVGPLNDKQIEINEILKTNSKQLQSQIEDLLTFNKSIIESDLSKRIEMPLNDIVNEAISEQKLSITGRKIKVKTSLKNAISKIDPEQMLVIFRNLLSNAIKYTPPGGEIRLSLKEKTSYIEFNIEDSGPGIHIDERDEVFRAFFKGKQDGTGYMKGTGLGLAIVSKFVHFHKGEVTLIDSAEGAHFRIRLPRTT